jgi:hypothetical protein
VKSAAYRELKTLDPFDWSFNPSVPRKQVFEGHAAGQPAVILV